MNLTLSAICVTYGRVAHLNNALACFLNQDYPNKELIILNTCPAQKFINEIPDVRIFNLDVRPASLGEARNMAIEKATGDACVVWDDDDNYLPHFLSVLGKHFTPTRDWIWLSRQFYSEQGKIKAIVQGTCNVLAFRKSAWVEAGGYPKMTVGEDRDFVAKLTSKTPGERAFVPDEDLSFIYTWGQKDVHHCSGLGDDNGMRPSAHERMEQDLKQRIMRNLEPTGQILLKPKLALDFQAMAKAFIAPRAAAAAPNGDTCIVQLGRAGDIINALPIAHHIYKSTGKKPHWMVSREFANLFDGVSYVEPYPVELTFHELRDAMMLANENFARVIKTQIYGRNHKQETICSSWPQESWRQAGCLDNYHNHEWRLEFDRRDVKREAALCAKIFRNTKPKIITNLTAAVSVPFPQGDRVLRTINVEFGKQYEIVDIGKLRCERIYDLLGLYERADIIISIDTSTMHLAAAVDVPLIALVNPNGWLGPVLRYNCCARIPYTNANPNLIAKAIKDAPAWWAKERAKRQAESLVSTTPPPAEKKLDLRNVTAWACCWSSDRDNLMRTLRVLRYCSSIIDFGEILLFSFLPVPKTGFPLRVVQIPELTPETWNIFDVHTAPHFINTDFACSIHEDGFPLDTALWQPEFFQYDYIGAPWPDGAVGNGGFCLQSKKFLQAKANLPFLTRLTIPVGTVFGMLHFSPSDDFVCRFHRGTLERQGLRFAPGDIAAQFSTEQTHKTMPSFGFHGRKAATEKYTAGWAKIVQSEKL